MNNPTIETKQISETRRARLVYDDLHETRGSYGYDTGEETKAAEDHEIDMLNRHVWIVLGAIVEEKCPHCGSWDETDSCWGIVVDNSEKGYRDAFEAVGVGYE